jgi:dipeptidyl aminopeptidase/acylaminoacyl peptidase
MLIVQGANDPRVTQLESEQIVAALEKNGGGATYVLYPDEGHGLVRPANLIDFIARVEKFFAEHLGGRYEPMPGDSVPGSTAVVRIIGN